MFYQRESRGPIFWNFHPFQLRPITFKIESTFLDLWIKERLLNKAYFLCVILCSQIIWEISAAILLSD